MSLNNRFYLLGAIFFASSLVFFAPVSILVRTQYGISMSEFFMLQAILSIAIFLFEIPCGVLTDRIGYKNSLILAQLIICLSRIIFLIGGDFWIFAIQALLEALGIALTSGTFFAYIYESDTKNYETRSATLANLSTLGFIVSTITFYPLNHYCSINTLVLATLISSSLACILLLFIPPLKHHHKKSSKAKPQFSIYQLIKTLVTTPTSLLIMITTPILSIGSFVVSFFYVLKLQALDIDCSFMTFIILGYSTIGLITPWCIAKIQHVPNTRVLLYLLNGLGTLFIILALINQYIVLIIMLIIPLFNQIAFVRLSKMSNKIIDTLNFTDNRASALSIMNQLTNALDVVFFFAASRIVGIDISVIFIATAALLLSISLVLSTTSGQK